jgi:hypothetical protein
VCSYIVVTHVNVTPIKAKHAATGFSSTGIKLDPNSDTPGGGIIPPCSDCTVHKAMANFAYKNGTQADVANGVYTHHIIIADFAGKSQIMPPVMAPFCKNGGQISPIPPMTGMGPKPPTTASASQPMAMGGMSHGGHSKRYPSAMKSKRQLGMSVFIGGGGSVGSGNPFSARRKGRHPRLLKHILICCSWQHCSKWLLDWKSRQLFTHLGDCQL